MAQSVEGYLVSDEELLLSVGVSDVDTEGESGWESFNSSYEVGATDRRIVILGSDGEFKDIEYSHISSVETETKVEEAYGAEIAGIIGAVCLLGGIGGLASGAAAAGLFGLVLALALAWVGMTLNDSEDETEKQAITIVTGDEAKQQIEFTTSENVGMDLSKIVRENRA